MANAESLPGTRGINITPAEVTMTASFLLAVGGLAGSFIHQHQVVEEADRIFPPTAGEELMSQAKATVVIFEGKLWDQIRLGETMIEVPSNVAESRRLVDAARDRDLSRQDYINRNTQQHVIDLTPTPENVSWAAMVAGLIGFAASLPFLPRRWRSALSR